MDSEIYETYIDDLTEKRKAAFKNITSKNKIKISTRKESITMSNMYDNIITYDEFKMLTQEEQSKHLLEYRKKYTCVEIAQIWNTNKFVVYDLNKRLKSFSNRKELDAIIPKRVKEKVEIEPVPKKKLKKQITEPEEKVKIEEVIMEMEIKPVLITINKTVSGEILNDYILKLLALFEEDNQIKFQMSINMLSNNKFKFAISVDDVFKVKDLIDYLLGIISSIPKAEQYTFSVLTEELETKPTEQTPIENKLEIPVQI